MASCKRCSASFEPKHHAQRYCGVVCKRAVDKDIRDSWKSRNKERVASSQRKYAEADPLRYRNNHYKKRYGLSLSDLESMLDGQGSECAICRKTISLYGVKGRDLAVVDHCHTTGVVRGMLCTPCNLMIGYAEDNGWTLVSAAQYVGVTV